MIHNNLPADWAAVLKPEFDKNYFNQLLQSINQAYQSNPVFPPHNLVFNAFNLCPFNSLKVVIIGQDPYHGVGQAHGLCFSVNDHIKQPPSLKNIFKELSSDIQGFKAPASGNLSAWAKQGILLLNAVLTVNAGLPGSHKNLGWENFTNAVIQIISEKKEHIVFLLWGNFAISKKHLIDENKHLVLTAAHPSPLARGAFFGCKHFSKTNQFLIKNEIEPINWHLDSNELF